ncbi:MAG: murein biosynthesis integral membrane protein MurJ [Desulfobacteraceae bacterium]
MIMMASIFLSRVIGYVRESVIAAVAGADSAVDAYRVAFSLPEILNHVLASGFLSVTFIPIFSKYLANKDEDGAWNIFSVILTTFGSILAVLIILSMNFAPLIVPLLAPGRKDPEFLNMAVYLTRIILPAQLFFFAGGILMAVQFAKEQFWIPALAPLVYNLGIICGGLFLGPRIGVEGFSWGALAGAFIGNFLIQIFGARRVGLRFRFLFNLRHKDLHRYILLTLPLMVGLTMVFSMEIFTKLFGSYLKEGSIAWLDFAKTIMSMPVSFFGQAIGVAAFPYLARLAAEKRWMDLNRMLNTLLRFLTTLIIPTAILMYVLRHEIIRVIYEHGEFGPGDTAMTAIALSGLLVGVFAIPAMNMVNRGFYAMQNTLLPAVYGSAAVVASLPVYWLGLKIYGLLGVALGVSFSSILQVAVLFTLWNRRSGNVESRSVYLSCLKTITAGIPLGVVLWGTHHFLAAKIDPTSLYGSLLIIAGVSVEFLAIMALGGWIFRVEGIRYIGERILKRLKRGSHPDNANSKI